MNAPSRRLQHVLPFAAALALTPNTAAPQVFRDARPPVAPIAAAADTTRGVVLLLANPHFQFSGGQTWAFDGARFLRASAVGAPGPYTNAVFAHDAGRGCTVAVQYAANAPQTWTWEHDGASWSLVSTATRPNVRTCRVAYAAHLGLVVLVGDDGTTWTYDGTDWSALAVAPLPAPNYHFALGYDPIRGVVVLLGGDANNAPSALHTWEFDGAAWTGVTTAHVPPPGPGEMVWDASRDELVLTNRQYEIPHRDWSFDGFDWRVIPTVVSPASWQRRQLVHDPASGRALLLTRSDPFLLYELLATSWAPITTSALPLAARGAGVAVDLRRDVCVSFGGRLPTSAGAYAFEDLTWFRYGDQWLPHPASPSPSPRRHHGMVYDAARDHVLLFGGARDGNVLGDTWRLHGGAWQPQQGAGPGPRDRFGMVYDPVRERVLLYGGAAGQPLGDVWVHDGAGWSALPTTNTPPARSDHAMCYDARLDRVVVFGGAAGANALDDAWTLRGDVWANAPPPPRGRSQANLVAVPGRARLELHAGAPPAATAELTDEVHRVAAAQPRIGIHGAGCAASQGVPALAPANGSAPAIGGTFTLELGGATPLGITLFGLGTGVATFGGAPLPIALAAAGLPGCHLWVAPQLFVPRTADAAGTALEPIVIPPLPQLSGQVLAAQAFVLDPAATNGFGAVSNAVVATLR